MTCNELHSAQSKTLLLPPAQHLVGELIYWNNVNRRRSFSPIKRLGLILLNKPRSSNRLIPWGSNRFRHLYIPGSINKRTPRSKLYLLFGPSNLIKILIISGIKVLSCSFPSRKITFRLRHFCCCHLSVSCSIELSLCH